MNYRICIVIFFVFLTSCVSSPKVTPFHYLDDDKHLRVATYNLNWGNGHFPVFTPIPSLVAIHQTAADIVLLQEVTERWEKLIEQSLASVYKYRRYYHYPHSGGKAVLSKYPIKPIRLIPPIFGWHPTWQLYIDTPYGKIQFFNVHLMPTLVAPNRLGFLGRAVFTTPRIRKQEIVDIYQYAKSGMPTIFAGDFNEGPQGRAIYYLHSKGMDDALDYVHRSIHTWRWKQGFVKLRGRYDHIFYSSEFKLVSAQVYHGGTSDHYPVVADFLIKK